MQPQAISFDIDGTLIDSVHRHARAWQETFARYGVDVTFDQVRSQIGKCCQSSSPKTGIDDGKIQQEGAERSKKALHKEKRGTQRSGTKGKAKSRKQAIAIGLSKARKKGAQVPTKKS